MKRILLNAPVVMLILIGCGGGGGGDKGNVQQSTTVTQSSPPSSEPVVENETIPCDFSVDFCDLPSLEKFRDKDVNSPFAKGVGTQEPFDAPVFGAARLEEFADVYFTNITNSLDPADYRYRDAYKLIRWTNLTMTPDYGYNIVRTDGRFILFNSAVLFTSQFPEHYELSDSDLGAMLAYKADNNNQRDFAVYHYHSHMQYPRTRYYWNLTASRVYSNDPVKTKLPRGLRDHTYFVSFDHPIQTPDYVIKQPLMTQNYQIASSSHPHADYSELYDVNTFKKREHDTQTYAVSRLAGQWQSSVGSLTIDELGHINGLINECSITGSVTQDPHSNAYQNAYTVTLDFTLCAHAGLYDGSLSLLTRKAPADANNMEQKYIDVSQFPKPSLLIAGYNEHKAIRMAFHKQDEVNHASQ